jgi:hypothetical protein|uniref:Uncharacterized protein n=1 Tax=viral metagenome TaxID=1070528 RepID=A0A6C0CT62_9ZZZZ
MDKDTKELNELKTRVALLEKMVLTLMTDQQPNEQPKRKKQVRMHTTTNRVRRLIY